MGNAPRKSHYPKQISSSGSGTKKVHWEGPGLPASPGKPILIPGTEETQPDVVSIRWERSSSNGGSAIIGYLVEHRKMGSPNWIRSTPILCKFPEVTLSGLEPGWRYQFRIRAQNALGLSEPSEISDPLIVTLQRAIASSPQFDLELSDTTSLENEQAEFEVKYSGTPVPKIAWFKDGFEIFSSRRTRIVTENGKSVLLIHRTALDDEGEIKCTATNRAGHVSTKARLMLEAPPRIRLPRQYEDGLLFEQDETIRLKVSLAGRPSPEVTWYHDGERIYKNERHIFESMDGESVLRIPDAKRRDRGEYSVKAANKLGEDIASFLVTVTDRPSGPGKATVAMTLGRSVTLTWKEPEDDGGCKIGTYIVEYYRVGWDMWLKAATCRQTSTTLGELIEGSEYRFRIKAENPYGVSDPSEESDVVFVPDLKRGITGPLSAKSQSHREIHRGRSEKREVSFVEPTQRTRSLTREENYSRENRVERSVSSQRLNPGKPLRSDSRVTFALDVADPEEMQTTKDQVPDVREKRTEPESVKQPATTIIVTPTFDDSGGRSPIPQPRSRSVTGPKDKNPPPPKPPRLHDPRNQAASAPPDRTHLSPPKNPISTLRKEQNFTDLSTREDSTILDLKRRQFSRTEPASFGEDDENALHGSSEFVLVLYPEDKETPDQISDHSPVSFIESGKGRSKSQEPTSEEEDLVPPPRSLSLPELFRIDHQIVETMREAVSSTELLHERAMERFYRAVAVEEAVDEAKRQLRKERAASESTADRDLPDAFDRYPLFEHRTSLRRKIPSSGAHSTLWQAKRDCRRSSDSQTDTLRVPDPISAGVLQDVASDPNLASIESTTDPWNTEQLENVEDEKPRSEDSELMKNLQYSEEVNRAEYSEEVNRAQYSEEINRAQYSEEVNRAQYSEEVNRAEYSEQYFEYSPQYSEQSNNMKRSEQVDNLQLSEPLRRWHDFSSEKTFSPIEANEEEDTRKIDDQSWSKKPYEEITETQSVETSIESSEEESSDDDLRQFRARILAIPIENEEDTYHPRGKPILHVSSALAPPVPPHRIPDIDPTPPLHDRIQYSVPSPPISPTNIVPKSILKKRVESDVPVNQFGRPVPPEKPIEVVRPQEDQGPVNLRKKTVPSVSDFSPEMALSESDIDNENVISAAEVARNRRRQLKQMSKSSVTSSDCDEEKEEERMAVVSHYTEIVKEYSKSHNAFPPRRVMTPTYSKTANQANVNLEESSKRIQAAEARTLSPPRARFDYSSDEKSSDNSTIYRDRNIVQQERTRELEYENQDESRSRKNSFSSTSTSRTNTETMRRGRSRIDEPSAPRSRNVSSERGASSRSSSKTRNASSDRGASSRSSSKTRKTTSSGDQSGRKAVDQSVAGQKSSRPSSRSSSRDRSRAQTPNEAKMGRLQRTVDGRKQRSRKTSTHERHLNYDENGDSYSKSLLEIQTEKSVRSTFSYVTDVILLMAAVYVYLFKRAILAIPIIGLILYRRIQQGVRDLFPKWLRRPKR